MVESSNQGDGVVRNVIYAHWRDDKPAEPGYSKELVGVRLDRKYWDKMEEQPPLREGCYTFLDYFEKHCQERRDESYLGTRAKLNDKDFGDYEWISYG
jgi:long-chain acyl-CoA synthetase